MGGGETRSKRWTGYKVEEIVQKIEREKNSKRKLRKMEVNVRKPTRQLTHTQKSKRKLIEERKLSKKQRSNFPKLRSELPDRI